MVKTTGAAHVQSRLAAMSACFGSILEYYDFFIYATAAAIVFPQLFFPSSNPQVAMIASLATFGIGYVMRPVGGFVLGYVGDRYGRKTILLVCMFLMGFSTVAVGLLPTYNQVGLLAPALLVLLRLIQGFAVAGEICGSSSLVLEHAPPGKRGFYGSFTTLGVQAGQILAAAVFIPVLWAMSPEAFQAWGWRLPFLASTVVIYFSFLIRRRLTETPVFFDEAGHSAIPSSPIAEGFRTAPADMARVLGMAAMNVIPVVATTFGAIYAVQPFYGINMPRNVYLWIPVLGNIVGCITVPIVGALSDRVGRRMPVAIGALGSGLLSFFYLDAIRSGNVTLSIVLALVMWGIVYQGYNGTYPSFMPELFPSRIRVTAMSIPFNIGVAISTFMPALFVAIAPPGSSSIPLRVGTLTLLITIIAAYSAWSARETYRMPIEQLGKIEAEAVVALRSSG